MAIAALITWVVTALGGFTLLSLWLRRGGLAQQESKTTSFRPGVVFGHFLFAAAGLVIWIIYVVTDTESLTWLSLGVLVVVALLGFTLLFRWLGVRRAPVTAGGGSAQSAGEPAERGLPVPIVAAHGVLAVATVVLVLLAALEIGG
jgi:flagellar basal body-associated protein FliL